MGVSELHQSGAANDLQPTQSLFDPLGAVQPHTLSYGISSTYGLGRYLKARMSSEHAGFYAQLCGQLKHSFCAHYLLHIHLIIFHSYLDLSAGQTNLLNRQTVGALQENHSERFGDALTLEVKQGIAEDTAPSSFQFRRVSLEKVASLAAVGSRLCRQVEQVLFVQTKG